MTWKTLRHPNVLPLLGVAMGNNKFAMVSEWMVNGNVNEYIKAYRHVNRFELVGLALLLASLLADSTLAPVAQRRC